MSQRPPKPVLYLLSSLSLLAVSGCCAHRNSHGFCEICPGMPIGEQYVQGPVVLPHGIPEHAEPAPAPSNTTQPPLATPPAPEPQLQPAPANTPPMPPEPRAGNTEPHRVVRNPAVPTGPQVETAVPYPGFSEAYSGPAVGYGQTWIEPEMQRDSLLRRAGQSLGRAWRRLKPNRVGTAVVDPWEYSNPQQMWTSPSVPMQTITPAPGATNEPSPTAQANPQPVTPQQPRQLQATHPYTRYRAPSRVSYANPYPTSDTQPIGGFWNQR